MTLWYTYRLRAASMKDAPVFSRPSMNFGIPRAGDATVHLNAPDSARDALWIAGNRKRKSRARAVIRFRPEAAVVSLDNGAADEESDAHAVALRRVEGIEQALRTLAVEARAGIPHGHADTIAVLSFGSNQQLPRAIVHANHCVRGIAKQVQDDLLELNAIPRHGREIVGELRLNDHSVSLKVARGQRQDLAVASFKSSGSRVNSLLLNSARNRVTTAEARWPSRIVRCAVSRAPSTFGGLASSIIRHVSALVMMPESG